MLTTFKKNRYYNDVWQKIKKNSKQEEPVLRQSCPDKTETEQESTHAEKVNSVWEQRLRIHYNCVGTIEIPSALPLPTPDVSVNTRKGVVVNYAPCDVAIQQIKNDECSLTAKYCKNIRHGADEGI